MATTSVAFANTPLKEDSSKKEEKTETEKTAKPKVIVECSQSVSNGFGGYETISVTGGNWFTSPSTAAGRCAENLVAAVQAYNQRIAQLTAEAGN